LTTDAINKYKPILNHIIVLFIQFMHVFDNLLSTIKPATGHMSHWRLRSWLAFLRYAEMR